MVYRRNILLLLITFFAVAGLALLSIGAQQADAQTAQKPNIVFINTDDLNKDQSTAAIWDDVYSRIKNRGATYTNFYVANALCCPSRASVMRGQYMHNTNIYGNDGVSGGYERMKELGILDQTIATKMDSLGYATAHVGKFTNNYDQEGNNCSEIPPGYDYWFAKCEDGSANSAVYSDQGSLWQPTSYTGYNEEDKFADEVNQFIDDTEANDSQPFYVQYWPRAPHTGASRGDYTGTENSTLPEPASFNEDNVSDKAAYIKDNGKFCIGTTNTATCGPDTKGDLQGDYRTRIESSKNADDQINRVINKLSSTGELDNTYIVFTSDNGYLLGEHRHWKKRVPYEESTNVPFYVRGPGIPEGVTREHVANNVDLLQTFARIGGGQGYSFTDGRPIDKTWLASSDPEFMSEPSWPRNYGFVEAADLTGDPPAYKAIYNQNTNSTYYRYPDSDEHTSGTQPFDEFYDLDDDPAQLNNSAATNQNNVTNLRAAASAMATCSADTCRANDH